MCVPLFDTVNLDSSRCVVGVTLTTHGFAISTPTLHLQPTGPQPRPRYGVKVFKVDCTGIWRKDYMRPQTVSSYQSHLPIPHGISGQGTHDFVPYFHLNRPALLLPLVFMTLGVAASANTVSEEWGYYCHKDEKLLSLCLLGRSVLGCWLLMSLGAGVGKRE